MRYSVTFLEHQYEALTGHLFVDREIERAAYLLCRISVSEGETRLLVREMIPVVLEDVESASREGIVIKQASYRQALKAAHLKDACFVFVHSHPEGFPNHSDQDDREEESLFRSAYARIHLERAIHASLVISSPTKPIGRVWLPDGSVRPLSRIRVLGRRFAFFDPDDGEYSRFALRVSRPNILRLHLQLFEHCASLPRLIFRFPRPASPAVGR